MTMQINLRMNDALFSSAKSYAEAFGYENVQDFIRELVREKVFEEDFLTPKEIILAQDLEELSDKHHLYSNEDDLRHLIRRKKDAKVSTQTN